MSYLGLEVGTSAVKGHYESVKGYYGSNSYNTVRKESNRSILSSALINSESAWFFSLIEARAVATCKLPVSLAVRPVAVSIKAVT